MTLFDDAALGSHDMPEPRETSYDLAPPLTSFPPQVRRSRRSPKRIAVGPAEPIGWRRSLSTAAAGGPLREAGSCRWVERIPADGRSPRPTSVSHPVALLRSLSRSSRRRIFPLAVFGSSSTNATWRGYL